MRRFTTSILSRLKIHSGNRRSCSSSSKPYRLHHAIKQFKSDPLGLLVKSIEKIASLKFVVGQSTPSDYNTAFRSTLNDTCATDSSQTFSDQFRLALYIK